MSAAHVYWAYHNSKYPGRPVTLCLIYDTKEGQLLSWNGGVLQKNGWSIDLEGRSLVLSFNARGPTYPRHYVRLERQENGSYLGCDDNQAIIKLEPIGGLRMGKPCGGIAEWLWVPDDEART